MEGRGRGGPRTPAARAVGARSNNPLRPAARGTLLADYLAASTPPVPSLVPQPEFFEVVQVPASSASSLAAAAEVTYPAPVEGVVFGGPQPPSLPYHPQLLHQPQLTAVLVRQFERALTGLCTVPATPDNLFAVCIWKAQQDTPCGCPECESRRATALRTGNIPAGTGTLLGIHTGCDESGNDLPLDSFWWLVARHLPLEVRYLSELELLEHGYLLRAFHSYQEACDNWFSVAEVTCFGLRRTPPIHIWKAATRCAGRGDPTVDQQP